MAPKKSAKKTAASAAKEVDKQLERYRSMRDFAMTAEPSGGETAKASAKIKDAAAVCDSEACSYASAL